MPFKLDYSISLHAFTPPPQQQQQRRRRVFVFVMKVTKLNEKKYEMRNKHAAVVGTAAIVIVEVCELLLELKSIILLCCIPWQINQSNKNKKCL
jgi:hypothetical protein